jgi:hypothetical protein
MRVLVVNNNKGQKCRDTRKEHKEQNKIENNISQKKKDSLKARHKELR